MKRLIVIVVAILSTTLFFSCSPKHSEMVVAELGPSEITMGEFEKAYADNVGSYESAKKDSLGEYKNFLDLYSKFKMKLRDAKIRGFENDPELIKELNDYKKNVGVSYLKQKKIIEKGMEELYDKRKEELRVSHIMIRTQNRSNEEAKEKAEEVLQKIKNGADFGELAKQYSEDQFSKNRGGDIYYMTAGMIVPSFEEAAYETKVGEVYPEPVKTRFGYHILKVTERQKRIPEVRASHILLKSNNGREKNGDSNPRRKLKDIRRKIVNGEAEFAEMAEKHSDDRGTAKKGGDLGYFGRRSMVLPFDSAAFSLDAGEVSDVVKTKFGYHLIKVTDKKSYPDFEEKKEELRKIYKKTRLDKDLDKFVNNIKDELNFEMNDSLLTEIESANDSVKFSGNYLNSQLRDKYKNSSVFYVNDKGFSLDSLVINIHNDGKFKNKKITAKRLKNAIDKYSGDVLLKQKAIKLVESDPPFEDLMKEYKNGIFVFKLQEDEIWNKINPDSTALYNYYQKHKENYKYPTRVDFSEIYSRNDSLIKVYYDRLVAGENFDSLAAEVTEREGMKEKAGHYGLERVNLNNESKKAYELKEGEFSKPFKVNRGWAIVKLNEKKSPSIKPFEEASQAVASDYQEMESNRLEEEYVKSLEERYNPKLYYEKLKSAYKKEEKKE